MARDKQIGLYVSEDEKDEWRDAVGEHPEAESLSHLIRIAVTHELAGGGSRPRARTPDESSGSVDQAEEILSSLDRIESSISVLQSSVDDLGQRVDVLEEETKAEGPQYDLQKAIYSVLPRRSESDAEEFDPTEGGATTRDIAALLDERGITVSETEVREAAKTLRETANVVGAYVDPRHSDVETGEGVYFYKEE